MSPKQWLALSCVYISYLFFGASVFHYTEHTTELKNRAALLEERIVVTELLVKHTLPEHQQLVMTSLNGYCDHPVTNYTLDEYPVDFEWTYFHSFWFSFIVCSTVGYGNSSPHDQPGQAFLIFYALIGLPLNGFVLAYLGKFFTATFTGIYARYKGNDKSNDHHHDLINKFGMIGSIALLLVPGIAFFIFLPACLFMYFEDWPYVRSVYYSFVTLTTIGFGDFVPTFQDGQARKFGTYFTLYQTFIIFWCFFGLGYFIMIIGFIAKGMQSKRIARLEHKMSKNLKETQHRIWTEVTKDVNVLRRFLNEVNMMKFRPVYSDSIESEMYHSRRSSSCPQISMYRSDPIAATRKRAHSESYGGVSDTSSTSLNRCHSEGDLSRIDKQKTFADSGSLFETKDLLSNVLNALGSIRPISDDMNSAEVENADSLYEYEWNGYGKGSETESRGSFTVPSHDESFMSRLNPFKDRRASHQENRRCSMISQDAQKYLELTSKGRASRISSFTSDYMDLLENTTVADLIRAVDGVQSNANITSATPLLGQNKSKLEVSAPAPRRGSLRPVRDYTTIFTSKNMSQSGPTIMPLNTTPKRVRRRIRSTSSSIPTVVEHIPSDDPVRVLNSPMSATPGNTESSTINMGAIPQMPIITVQAPNVSRPNVLWHPEYDDEKSIQNEIRRKRTDSK